MVKEIMIEMLVEGGKAATTPAIAQQLGPLKMNIANVMSEVNKKTEGFSGIKVPVKLKVNAQDKSFDISVGTPPVTELIKRELGIEKGSGTPDKEKIGNLAIEQLIKIAKMKQDGMFVNSLKSAIKTIAGSCNSLGLLIEGKTSREFNRDLDSRRYDKEITEERTELSKEKIAILKQQLAEVQDRLRREQERLKAMAEAEKAKAEKAEKVEAVEEAVAEMAGEKKAEKVEKKAAEEKVEAKEEKKDIKEKK